MGRTKRQVLKTLKDDFDIADMACSEIRSADITSLATELGKTRGPATVANYLSHLGAVFAIARAAWNYPLDPAVMKDGNLVAKKLGLTGKGKERDRRPTLAELNIIMSHYQGREQNVDMLPMTKIVPFAIFSTRRQEEIVTLKWADLDEDHSPSRLHKRSRLRRADTGSRRRLEIRIFNPVAGAARLSRRSEFRSLYGLYPLAARLR
jgi:hypothetical protein